MDQVCVKMVARSDKPRRVASDSGSSPQLRGTLWCLSAHYSIVFRHAALLSWFTVTALISVLFNRL